jgi:hypothetical protein
MILDQFLSSDLKMIARQKDSGFGWKIEDFEFRAAFTIFSIFIFLKKKSKKSNRNLKKFTKSTKWWN